MALLTERIIGCAMKVHTTLGPGYLEKVYENALVLELVKVGMTVEQQKPIPVFYDGGVVGDFIADLIVNEKVLLENKSVVGFSEVFTSICLSYLKSTRLPVCLLINFNKPRLEWKRFVGETYPTEPDPL